MNEVRLARWVPVSLPGCKAIWTTLLVWMPMVCWYAALRPGLMSSDSLSVWRQATSGDWVDLHPPVYTAAMLLSASIFDHPGLLTLGQSLFLAASVVAVARSLVRLGAPVRALWFATGALAVSPMLGAFSISLWKDVPYTAAVLFASARIIDLACVQLQGQGGDVVPTMKSLTLWLVAATLFRQNGVIFAGVVLSVLMAIPRGRRRSVAAAGGVVVLSLVLVKLVVYPAAGVERAPTQASLAMFMHDIAAVARTDPSVFDRADRSLMGAVAPFETWRTSSKRFGCTSANWEWGPEFAWVRVEGRADDYFRLWAEVLGERPRRVVTNRLCVGAIAWRPDNVGAVYTVSRGIDTNEFGLKTEPIVQGLETAARGIIDATDTPSVQWVLWRGPPWIYAGWVALVIAALRRRRPVILLAGLPPLALQLSVFPFNPAQDARYMFAGVLLGVLMLPLAGAAKNLRDEGGPEASESFREVTDSRCSMVVG